MSKIFKCFVCGLLGIVIGAGATFGAMTAAVYYSYGNVTVSSVIGDSGYNDVLGDLKDFSVDEILGLIKKGQTNPENYTFRDLELKYGFDTVALINKFGGGNDKIIADDGSNAKYVEQLKDVSPFTLLKGGDGAKKFLDNLPFGAVLSFIPSSTLFSEETRVILRRYSVGDMFEKDPITGETGIAAALRDVKVGGVLPVLFDYDETADTYKVKDGKYSGLSLVGNLGFGPFIDLATGKKDAASLFGEGGFFTDKTVGEYLESLGVTDKTVTERIDAALSGLTVSDLFNKNYETGKYEFVLENLLGSINVGGALGYVYDGGVWYKNKDKTETVDGLMAVIASFDLTKIYRALKSNSSAWEKIREVALSLGDASFGDILETLGYKYNGEKWLNKDGKEPKAGILVAMSDVAISDLLGGKDELDATALRKKIAEQVILHCKGMTVGDGFGGLMKVTYSEEKKAYVFAEGSDAGKEVNGALNELLLTEINDVAKIFAADQIDGEQIERVLLTLADGIKVGYVLGANSSDDGSWTSAQGKAIEAKYYKFYEVTLDKLIAPFFDGAEASDIFDIFIDALGEETTLGEVVAPFLGCDVADGKVIYAGSSLQNFAFAIDKIFSLALAEFKGLKGGDLLTPIKNAADKITVGNLVGYELRDDGKWYDFNGAVKETEAMTDKIFVRIYEKTVKEVTGDSAVFDDILDDFTVGEMMGLKYCDGVGDKCDFGAEHAHVAAGWYKNDGVTRAGVAEEKLADKTIKEVSDEGLDLEAIFTGTKLGEMMNGFYSDGKWYEDEALAKPLDEITNKVYELDLGQLIAGKTDINAVFNEVSVGKVMKLIYCDGTNCSLTHTHSAGWYEEDGSKATLVKAKLAAKTLGDLMNDGLDLGATFTGSKLGEMMNGVTYDEASGKWSDANGKVSAVMQKLYDLDLGQLLDGNADIEGIINDMLVGEAMNKTKKSDGWYDENDVKSTDALMNKLYDKPLGDLLNGNFNFEELFEGLTIGDAMKKHKGEDGFWYDEDGVKSEDALMNALYGQPLDGLLKGELDVRVALKDVTVGEAAGIGKNSDGEWESGDALTKKLYDKTLGDLFDGNIDFGATFKGVTMGEVMGYTLNGGVWYKDGEAVTDPISKTVNGLDIGEVISGNVAFDEIFDGVKLGELMNYTYCDGTNCSLTHTHAAGWYDKSGQKASGISACMAGFTVEEVKDGKFAENLTTKINNEVTLSDIVGNIDETNPLSLIGGNTKIGEISDAMKGISGKTLGEFHRVGIISADETKLDGAFEKILKLIASDIANGKIAEAEGETYTYKFAADIRRQAAAHIETAADGTVTCNARKFWTELTFTEMIDCMISASASLPEA